MDSAVGCLVCARHCRALGARSRMPGRVPSQQAASLSPICVCRREPSRNCREGQFRISGCKSEGRAGCVVFKSPTAAGAPPVWMGNCGCCARRRHCQALQLAGIADAGTGATRQATRRKWRQAFKQVVRLTTTFRRYLLIHRFLYHQTNRNTLWIGLYFQWLAPYHRNRYRLESTGGRYTVRNPAPQPIQWHGHPMTLGPWP